MGYEGALLSGWFDEGARLITEETLHQLAHVGGARMKELTVAHTPQSTGHLKSSWKQKPVVKVLSLHGFVYESGVETHVDYAPYVEHGTGLWGPKHSKYPIRPKLPGGVLHFFTATGAEVFTRLVMHPGSPGAHMIAIAAAETEAVFAAAARPELELWARRAERKNEHRVVNRV